MFRWIILISTILYILLILCHTAIKCAEIRQLPFCDDLPDEKIEKNPPRSLIYISTLDGNLAALDASLGTKIWTLDLQEEPLLHSSIHRRDLNNNGQWVKLIPSLRGGLYKFDGENLESVPFSIDQLLQSSFRYSDDLIFSGGKETKTYGISASTGNILYECKISSCTNATNGDSIVEEDILIVRRHQHTIRAGEPTSGTERWNFSVGLHDLSLIPNSKSTCKEKSQLINLNIDIQAVIPKGLVVVYDKDDPSAKLWEYKFNSPIVKIWREKREFQNEPTNYLEEVNLFDSARWDSEFSDNPGLYLGMHDRQLYVQENSAFITKEVGFSTTNSQSVKFPWRPYPATEISTDLEVNKNTDISVDKNEVSSATALSVLYDSEYINGNGFYLYSKDQIQQKGVPQCNESEPNHIPNKSTLTTPEEFEDPTDTPVQVIIVSLWYWWKEVLIISFSTALIMNFVLTQKFLYHGESKDAIMPPLIVERHVIDPKEDSQNKSLDNGEHFTSRYLTDYESVDCLGRGGYGIVFEARNKIDDCKYAIKRIALSNSQMSRERVMREVKALAKLDHQNIVRYFNAWLECPPPNWQEEHDIQWLNKKFPESDFISESSNIDNSVHIDVPTSNSASVDSALEAVELNNDLDDLTESSCIIIKETTDDPRCITESFNEDGSCSLQLSQTNSDKGIDENNDSDESIVFEATHSKSRSSKEVSHRKSQMNLNLKKRKDSSKSNTKMFLYIQMQLCQRISLRDWLKTENSNRNPQKIINVFQQIVDAVHYVHLQGLIHRDLKPSNIFFSFDNKIKIGDFGLVTAMTESENCNGFHTPCENDELDITKKVHTARVGTHLYMSPEQMNGKNYNYKVDIYSLGVILFELLIPFQTEMERVTTLTNLKNSTFPEDFSLQYPEEYELLKLMLDKNPENRPTTIGIKDRPPLKNNETQENSELDKKWHFELPPLSRNSSITNSSGSDSWEKIC